MPPPPPRGRFVQLVLKERIAFYGMTLSALILCILFIIIKCLQNDNHDHCKLPKITTPRPALMENLINDNDQSKYATVTKPINEVQDIINPVIEETNIYIPPSKQDTAPYNNNSTKGTKL